MERCPACGSREMMQRNPENDSYTTCCPASHKIMLLGEYPPPLKKEDESTNMTATQVDEAIDKWSKEAGQQFATAMGEALKPALKSLLELVEKHRS